MGGGFSVCQDPLQFMWSLLLSLYIWQKVLLNYFLRDRERVLWQTFQSWCLSDTYICVFSFQTVDDLLRCGICFEYFNIAMMIPQCSHNCKYVLFLWISKNVIFIKDSVNLTSKISTHIYFSPLVSLTWSFQVFSTIFLLNIEVFTRPPIFSTTSQIFLCLL